MTFDSGPDSDAPTGMPEYPLKDQQLIAEYAGPESQLWAPTRIFAVILFLIGLCICVGASYFEPYPLDAFFEAAFGVVIATYGAAATILGERRYQHLAKTFIDAARRPEAWEVSLFGVVVGIVLAAWGFEYAGRLVAEYQGSGLSYSLVALVTQRSIVGLVVVALGAVLIAYNVRRVLPPLID